MASVMDTSVDCLHSKVLDVAGGDAEVLQALEE